MTSPKIEKIGTMLSNASFDMRLMRAGFDKVGTASIQMKLSLDNLFENNLQPYTSDTWLEPKVDGVFAEITFVSGQVACITNKKGVDVTHKWPDLVSSLRINTRTNDFVVLGEIVVREDNVDSFSLTAKRDAQVKPSEVERLSKQHPATFYAFQVPGCDYVMGRKVLKASGLDVVESIFVLDAMVKGKGDTLIKEQMKKWAEHHPEGCMKKVTRPAILTTKIKYLSSYTLLITGITKGRNHGYGSFTVAALSNNESGIVPMGKVGSGVKLSDFEAVAEMSANYTSIIAAEISCMGWTSSGKLRQPTFKGLRTDVDLDDIYHLDTLTEEEKGLRDYVF